MVAPRCPDENGRSCLKGTRETGVAAVEVDKEGMTTEGIDRSRVRVLKQVP